MTVLEMKQKLANMTTNIRAHLDRFADKEMSAEDSATLSNMETEFSKLQNKIAVEEKQLAREREMGEVADLAGRAPGKNAVLDAFRDHLKFGSDTTLKIYNALQQDNPTQAGYLVPPQQFVMDVIKDLTDLSIIRKRATVKTLTSALSLGFPTRTAGMSSFSWGTEISAPTPDTTLAFGKKEFKPNPGSSLILVSRNLIRNSPVAEDEVRTAIVEEVDGGEETAFMSGSGVGQPLGIFTASADGIPATRDVSTGNTITEVKFDGLMNAKYSIKGQNRTGAEWFFNKEAILQLQKLKDNNGQYIWQPNVALGTPGTLLGDTFNDSEYVPHVFTTGLYVGAYGNPKNYWIVDSLAMEIRVLVELYALTNQIAYITRIETDGMPVKPNSWVRVKLS